MGLDGKDYYCIKMMHLQASFVSVLWLGKHIFMLASAVNVPPLLLDGHLEFSLIFNSANMQ